jgi:hypothetical protein
MKMIVYVSCVSTQSKIATSLLGMTLFCTVIPLGFDEFCRRRKEFSVQNPDLIIFSFSEHIESGSTEDWILQRCPAMESKVPIICLLSTSAEGVPFGWSPNLATLASDHPHFIDELLRLIREMAGIQGY